MKNHVFHGKFTDTIEITAAHQSWQLARDGRIVGATIGFNADDDFNETTIIVDGLIKGAIDVGVITEGNDSDVIVGRTGHIVLTADNTTGILTYGDDTSVVNSGRIEATAGVITIGARTDVLNEAGGTIIGSLYGVALSARVGERNTLTNHGLIQGGPDGAAVLGAEANDRIVNDGRIVGRVQLGQGDDTVDTRGGSITGGVYGNSGDDTLVTSDAGIALNEDRGEGDDTVKATVSYTLPIFVENLFLLGSKDINGFGGDDSNQIHGNAGDNVLRGRGGNDKLFGEEGNDRLFGGADGDFFQFATGWDHDRIADFEQGLDLIDVSQWKGIDDFTDVFKHSADGKHGVVITLGDDSLTIEGITRADMVGGDFMF